MKRTYATLLPGCLALLLVSCTFNLSKHAAKSPKEKAKAEIYYIASAKEMKAFKQLETAAGVAEFMREFWAVRDQTPGTVLNERRQEHLARMEFANEHFGDYREGWRTDRGRALIIYGPPDNVDSSPNVRLEIRTRVLQDLEVWYYYDPHSGDPSHRGISLAPGEFIFADVQGNGIIEQISSNKLGEPGFPLPSSRTQSFDN